MAKSRQATPSQIRSLIAVVLSISIGLAVGHLLPTFVVGGVMLTFLFGTLAIALADRIKNRKASTGSRREALQQAREDARRTGEHAVVSISGLIAFFLVLIIGFFLAAAFFEPAFLSAGEVRSTITDTTLVQAAVGEQGAQFFEGIGAIFGVLFGVTILAVILIILGFSDPRGGM